MRVLTLVLGALLALLTALWSAPLALASADPPGPPEDGVVSGSAAPGGSAAGVASARPLPVRAPVATAPAGPERDDTSGRDATGGRSESAGSRADRAPGASPQPSEAPKPTVTSVPNQPRLGQPGPEQQTQPRREQTQPRPSTPPGPADPGANLRGPNGGAPLFGQGPDHRPGQGPGCDKDRDRGCTGDRPGCERDRQCDQKPGCDRSKNRDCHDDRPRCDRDRHCADDRGPRPACERDRRCDSHHGRGPGWERDNRIRFIYLDPGAAFRGDDVDVSVRCDSNRAFLSSNVLKNITLHRDGRRLTGSTHVEDDADFGRGWVRVECGDGDRYDYDTDFRVLRDRDHEAFLDLDPAAGERGDEIDITVGCDTSVGEVRSDALDDVELERDGRRGWRFRGTTHVEDDADFGEHSVKVRCGDDVLEETFFVKGGDSDDGDDGKDDGKDDGGDAGPVGGDQVSVWPKGAPETGGGPVGAPLGAFALGMTALTGAATPGGSGARRPRA